MTNVYQIAFKKGFVLIYTLIWTLINEVVYLSDFSEILKCDALIIIYCTLFFPSSIQRFDPPAGKSPDDVNHWQSKKLTKWKSPMSVWGWGHIDHLADDTEVFILMGAQWVLQVLAEM